MGSGRPQAAGHPIGAYGESERELTVKTQQKPGRAMPFPAFVYERLRRGKTAAKNGANQADKLEFAF